MNITETRLEKIAFSARLMLSKHLLEARATAEYLPDMQAVEVSLKGMLLGENLGSISIYEPNIPKWLRSILFRLFGSQEHKYEISAYYPNFKPKLPDEKYKFVSIELND